MEKQQISAVTILLVGTYTYIPIIIALCVCIYLKIHVSSSKYFHIAIY